jgi:hypothetical protein
MRSHLLNLPKAPKANGLVTGHEGFQPSSSAWLNTVWQNWCTYGPGNFKKDTIVFTNLSREALPDRKCKAHCKRPDKSQPHPNVVDATNDFERAQWPREFVGAALRACVGQQAYAGL